MSYGHALEDEPPFLVDVGKARLGALQLHDGSAGEPFAIANRSAQRGELLLERRSSYFAGSRRAKCHKRRVERFGRELRQASCQVARDWMFSQERANHSAMGAVDHIAVGT